MNKIAKLLLLLSLTIGGTTTAYAQQVFKIASLAPQGSDWIVRLEKGAKQITKETEGRVKFKIFSGGIQGCLLYTSPSPRDRG